MMRAADILEELSKDRIINVAQKLGLNTSGATRSELVSRITRALTNQRGPRGNQAGWRGAVQVLVSELTRDDIVTVLRGDWDLEVNEEEDGYTTSGEIHRLRVDEARELLLELCLNEGAEYESIFKRWGHCFWKRENLFDDNESGEQIEQELDAATEEDAPSWQQSTIYSAGPGRRLPDGMQKSENPLFSHQSEAVEKLAHWYEQGGPRGVLCLPTGAGKTRTTAAFVLRHVLPKQGRVLWLAHRHELVNQAIGTFLEAGHESPYPFTIARFESGRRRSKETADVVVASIPTLAWGSHLPNLHELFHINQSFDLVVMDECHHGVAKTWKRLLRSLFRDVRYTAGKLLGLSATPTRTAESEITEFWKLFGDIIHEVQPLPLIRAGILSRPKVFCVSTDRMFEASQEEQNLFEQFEDLPTSLVREIAEDEERNELIVKTYLKNNQWGPTLIFTATLQQAETLRELLQENEVDAQLLHGGSTPEQRRETIKEFKDGRLPVLLNVALFMEGTDLPAVQSVFIARPTLSRILFQQMVGRGLRGPQLGGTDNCNIVAFHDDVQGLITAQFSSTFSDEREALEALGLPDAAEIESASMQVADTQAAPPNDAAHKDQREQLISRLKELAMAVRTQATSHQERLPPMASSLIGWWEADEGPIRRYLPVFSGELEAAGSRIGKLLHLASLSQPLPEYGWSYLSYVPEEVFQAFAGVVMRGSVPRYVDLSTSSIQAVVRMTSSLSELLPSPDASASTPSKAATSPRWLDIARVIKRGKGDYVLITLDGTVQAHPASDIGAIRDIWDAHRTILPPEIEESAIQVFSRMAAMSPTVAHLPSEFVQTILSHAAKTGGMPDEVSPSDSRPSLTDIRRELQGIPRAERLDASEIVFSAFFAQQFESREEFLLSLLDD